SSRPWQPTPLIIPDLTRLQSHKHPLTRICKRRSGQPGIRPGYENLTHGCFRNGSRTSQKIPLNSDTRIRSSPILYTYLTLCSRRRGLTRQLVFCEPVGWMTPNRFVRRYCAPPQRTTLV